MCEFKRAFIILFFCSLLPMWVFAEIDPPLRKIHALGNHVDVAPVTRVSTAQVVLADYELIKKDFAHTRAWSKHQIDEWLLGRVAMIADTQAEPNDVNTPITLGAETEVAYRPREYNRALVFEVEGGLIDAKGMGARNPSQADHSNGLATLGEVMREYLYQKMVQMLFDHDGSGLKTIGSYAVINWGFQVIHADGSKSPAGAIFRQAHRRFVNVSSLLAPKEMKRVERVLRKYGVTSAGSGRFLMVDRANIQGTDNSDVVDFGAFLTVKDFSKTVVDFLDHELLFQPTDEDFVQPHPELRVPFHIWGTTVSGQEDPKKDNPWVWSHELADAFAEGRASRDHVEQHARNLLAPVANILSSKTCAHLLSGDTSL